ncbi:zeta toxin family protein [Streptomyces sp. NPDC006649]|uniref:zeta toxin family protein n=1 Tax=Streptomyces sp. NPDC006649 TaxID=3156896 RepID=UPI0033B03893
MHRDLPEDERLAVQRDTGRAAALAEPVRPHRPAPQASAGRGLPPAVARRTRQDLRRADRSVVPEQHHPPGRPAIGTRRGPAGAGKLLAARTVLRAMRPGTTRLVGDDFKIQHPDYLQLLRDDPRGAGAAIRADYRAWFARAGEYVRRHCGDVLIEAAPSSVEEFLASALPYATDGYPVDLVVLAVREADSRLATALRYARALQHGLPARFTTAQGHNTCFAALTDIVALAEHHPQIAAMIVIRRDGQALLPYKAGGPGRASWVLAAERLRPYTEQEARAFLTLHQALRRALPRHRAELEEILALARPLMPPQVQPVAIGRPDPLSFPVEPNPWAAEYSHSSGVPFRQEQRTPGHCVPTWSTSARLSHLPSMGLRQSFVRSSGPGVPGMAVSVSPLDGSNDLAVRSPATTRPLIGATGLSRHSNQIIIS